MGSLKSLKQHWDARAKRYAKSYAGWKAVCLVGAPEFINKLLDMLHRSALKKFLNVSGTRVLDVGCGVGRVATELANRGNYVIGIDISKEMIKVTKGRTKERGVDTLIASATHMPFQADYFNLTISLTVLQFITDNTNFLLSCRELARVTGKRGRVVLLELSSVMKHVHAPHIKSRTPKTYINCFQRQGLNQVYCRGVDFPFLQTFLELITKRTRWLKMFTQKFGLPTTLIDLILSLLIQHFLLRYNLFYIFSQHGVFVFQK